METLLVRLKAYEPRRGHVLRRFTYAHIRFDADRGWYRVPKQVAEYLRTVRQVATKDYSPLAFDVATEEEAREIDAREEREAKVRRGAAEPVQAAPREQPTEASPQPARAESARSRREK